MNKLFLRADIARAWQGRDAFACAQEQRGEIAKHKDGRRTLRFSVGGQAYFLKYHGGVGWREILLSLLQLRLPVLDAGPEYRAALRLAAAGVPSLVVAAYGSRGPNPARRQSFLVTEALEGRLSLETFCAAWPGSAPAPHQRRLLIERVAGIAAGMHGAGVNHRDFYLCHLLLDAASLASARVATDVRVNLIDLHRAQRRTRVPRRWRVKDLAALQFSALAIGLTRRDRLRFLRAYFGVGLRLVLQREVRLLAAVERRTEAFRLSSQSRS